jgi:hypothetical protein
VIKQTLAAVLLLSLTACGESSDADISTTTSTATIIFDPDSGDMSLPNDLWFLNSEDGTLNISYSDGSETLDPYVAINASDGWSTHHPFVIEIEFDDDTELDETTIDANSVQLFSVTMGSDSDTCANVDEHQACSMNQQLTFGSDYTAKVTTAGLKIEPLSPLEPKTTYLLVLTDTLLDSDGSAVAASASYQALAQDVTSSPLESEDDLEMQGIINSYEAVATAAGVDADSIIFTMAMTTQSVDDVMLAVKDLVVDSGAATLTVSDSSYTIAQLLSSYGYSLSDDETSLFSTGNYYSGTLSLPYYAGISTTDDPYAPLTEHWSATQEIGSEYNLTQYNPTPAENNVCDTSCVSDPGEITVQMTVPNVSDLTNAVRANYGLSELTEPDAGWPVVILQHGVTSQKEDMLAVTGILSTFGFATIAIDMPLHGERGFDLDDDGTDDINASSNLYTDYINLTSLLVTRDNVRQSIADLLGLRYALQNLSGANIDSNDVQFMGHSLGAITGLSFTALANTTTGTDATDAEFAIGSASLANPGVGIPGFLLESGYFGSTIEASLAYTYSDGFQSYFSENDYLSDEIVTAYTDYYTQLDDDDQVTLDSLIDEVVLAAQTAVDSGDPVNYTATLADLGTPLHLIEVVGSGDNYSDQVIPNEVAANSNAGTEAAISQLAMTAVSESTTGTSFAVRFTYGYHSSILSSSDCSTYTITDDAEALCEAATSEMQSEMASFLYYRGQYLPISNSDVLEATE